MAAPSNRTTRHTISWQLFGIEYWIAAIKNKYILSIHGKSLFFKLTMLGLLNLFVIIVIGFQISHYAMLLSFILFLVSNNLRTKKKKKKERW